MGILKYIIPAVVIKKVYSKKYTSSYSSGEELTDKEKDALADLKDDA